MDGKLLLTVDDVANALTVTPRTVWRMVKAGEIPKPVKLGGCTRWRRARIEKCVAALDTKANGEDDQADELLKQIEASNG